MLSFRQIGPRPGLFLVIALGCAGCSTAADVSGTVTYKGRPVAFGTVMISGADGVAHYATLDRDGTYAMTGAPLGKVRVAVNSPDPNLNRSPAPVATPGFEKVDPQDTPSQKPGLFKLPKHQRDGKIRPAV